MVPGSAASPSSSERPVTYTVAPCAPSARAMPLPAPREAPVTIVTAPFSSSAMACLLRSLDLQLARQSTLSPPSAAYHRPDLINGRPAVARRQQHALKQDRADA